MTPSDGVGRFEARAVAINWSLLATLRFFLAFVVVNSHLINFTTSSFSLAVNRFGGKAAVTGFLIISGYSISASLERAPARFLFRRFLRIYPAYIVAIAVAIVLQLSIGHYRAPGMDFPPSGALTILGNVLLVQSYLVRRIDFDPVVWSLSLEFSYYILAMYLDRIPHLMMVLIAAASVVLFVLPGDLWTSLLFRIVEKANMVFYLWPFLLGLLLHRRPYPVLFLLGAVVCVPLALLSRATPEPWSVLTMLLTIGIVYLADRGIGRRSLLLDYLGDVSYPLYLIHVPVFIALAAFARQTDPWILGGAALLAALAITGVVEQPLRAIMIQLNSLRIKTENELQH